MSTNNNTIRIDPSKVKPQAQPGWTSTKNRVIESEAKNLATGEREVLKQWHQTKEYKCPISGKTARSGSQLLTAINRARRANDPQTVIHCHHINSKKHNPELKHDPRNLLLVNEKNHREAKQAHRGGSTQREVNGRLIDREASIAIRLRDGQKKNPESQQRRANIEQRGKEVREKFEQRQFQQNVKVSSLEKSYNSSNRASQFQHPSSATKGGAMAGEIGGVAVTSADGFKDWDKNINCFNQSVHTICIPNETDGNDVSEWSSSDISQIMVELCNGIHQYGTIPFFSLHFNQDGSMYTVLHPAYHNTLVGKVILILDYYMKGFINGGFLQEEYAMRWSEKTRTLDPNALKNHMVDIKEEITNGSWKNIKGLEDYKSLRERAFEMGLEGENGLRELEMKFKEMVANESSGSGDVDIALQMLLNATENLNKVSGLKYQTSFRILASERSASCVDGVFMVDGDFEVKYTIEPTPAYQEYLDAYLTYFGSLPIEHQLQEELYKEAAQAIHDQMPLLPPCKRYFRLLKHISFLSSYISTLMGCGQTPDVVSLTDNHAPVDQTPNLLPPLPVRYYEPVNLTLTVSEIITTMERNKPLITKFHGYLNSLFRATTRDGDTLNKYSELQSEIRSTINNILRNKLSNLGVNGGNLNSSIQRLASGFLQLISMIVGTNSTQVYTTLVKDVMKPMIQLLERYNEVAANYQAPWPRLEEIENDPNVVEAFQAKLKDYAISLEDLKISAMLILESCKNHILKDFCSGCKGDIKTHKVNVKIENSECRNEYVNSLLAQFRSMIDQLRLKYQSEGFFTKIFSNTSAELNRVKQMYDRISHGYCDIINEVIRVTLPEWELAVAEKLQVLAPVTEATKEFFDDNLINYGKSTTTLLRERIGDMDILKMVGETRNDKMFDLISKSSSKTSDRFANFLNKLSSLGSRMNSIVSMLTGEGNGLGFLPVSKLVVPDKNYLDNKQHQRVWGGCGLVLAPLEIQSTFPSKTEAQSASFAINIKQFTHDKLCQLVHFTDGSMSYSAFSFNVCQIDQYNEDIDEDEFEEDLQINTSRLDTSILAETEIPIDEKYLIDQLTKYKHKLFELDQFGNSLLNLASAGGRSTLIKPLIHLMGSKYLEHKNTYGLTPLATAVISNHYSTVKVLLEFGADPNTESNNMMFPLLSSILECHSDIANLLVNYCKLDKQWQEGDTALHVALTTGQMDVAINLLSRGASTNIARKSDLFTVVEVVSQLALNDIIKEIPLVKDRLLPSQGTALHVAVENNSFEIVQFLLSQGWSASIQQLNGNTPLILALDKCYSEIANLLLSHGGDHCNVNPLPPPTKQERALPTFKHTQCVVANHRVYINSKKQTATMIAISKGYTDIAWNLISIGKESWKHKDHDGYTLLDYIILYGESSLLEKVLNSIGSLNVDGFLPNNRLSYLAWALMQKKIELADVLLKMDAKYIHPDPQWTIGAMAVRSNHVGLLYKLIEPTFSLFKNGTTFDIEKLVYENSLLEISAENGSTECAQLLFNQKKLKNIDTKSILCNSKGTELMYYAISGRSQRLIEIVLRWYDDLNIPLNQNGDSIISLLISTEQLSLLPLFQNRGLKLNHFGIGVVESAVRLDMSESIYTFIKESNLELLKSQQEPLGHLFYYNLGLRAYDNQSKKVLKKFSDEISLAFKHVDGTSSDFTILTMNTAEPLLLKLINRYSEEDIEMISKLFKIPNLTDETLVEALYQTLKFDNRALLSLFPPFNLSKKYKFFENQAPISIYQLFSTLNAVNCWKLLKNQPKDIVPPKQIENNPSVLKNLQENLDLSDDTLVLNSLKQLKGLNKITLTDRNLPLLHTVFFSGCPLSFKYCLEQGCDPLAIHSQFNILFTLARDPSKLGLLLSILEKNYNTEQLDYLFNQKIETMGITISHFDLLLTLIPPNALREAFQSCKMSSDNHSKLVIKFSNTLGVVIDEVQICKEMKDQKTDKKSVFQHLTSSNRKLPRDKKFIAPEYLVKPTLKVQESLLHTACNAAPSFILEWFPSDLKELKIQDQTDLVQLERVYHHSAMLNLINSRDKGGCTPLMKACQIGENQVVKRLLQYGADTSLVDNQGNSVFIHSLSDANPNPNLTCSILLPYSTSTLSIANHRGILPISFMAGLGLSNLVSQLLMKGGYVDQDGKYNHKSLNQSVS
ncbi:Preprotein translocase secA subunit [Heterostelium album PN500]|uniref:Preprotein translocase secA subunit n=1 Tax=Heterostelium pallidum (strain ATCC 26659 / Pp 5 / PN500) TaxID=670386 RepID=D3B998_HETP5|nr:Preprotein translocase secA subunit [Heterostelium album PN500]EFA82137.1 Preprotein translocase secA subunit [Heterostelium album PN500]|eukprot:XP_020434254.1 Preprotein translocase secA subunit [Heterostelium album PN500]